MSQVNVGDSDHTRIDEGGGDRATRSSPGDRIF